MFKVREIFFSYALIKFLDRIHTVFIDKLHHRDARNAHLLLQLLILCLLAQILEFQNEQNNIRQRSLSAQPSPHVLGCARHDDRLPAATIYDPAWMSEADNILMAQCLALSELVGAYFVLENKGAKS